jgi:hypothetical protein
LVIETETWYDWVEVSPVGLGLGVTVGVVVVGGLVDVGVVVVVVGAPLPPLDVGRLDAVEPDEPVALVAVAATVLAPDVVAPAPDCCKKGSRPAPASRAWVGPASTLTAGTAADCPGAPETGAATDAPGAAATLLEPLDNSTGTAISATSSAAAIGHSRRSRRSSMMLRTNVIGPEA